MARTTMPAGAGLLLATLASTQSRACLDENRFLPGDDARLEARADSCPRSGAPGLPPAPDGISPALGVTWFGTACPGLQGYAVFDVTGSLKIGGDIQLTLGSVPLTDVAILFLGPSNTQWGSIPLPLELRMFNSPGCWLNVSPDFVLYAGPPTRVSAPIPNDPALSGTHLYFQWVIHEPPSSIRPFFTTRGADVVLGS